jgi:uncharacterized protein involved in cysteine biosynthesis
LVAHGGTGWIGLQKPYDWLLALPLVMVLYILGFVISWIGGMISAVLYKSTAHAQSKTITPAQTHT